MELRERTASRIERALQKIGTKRRAKHSARFFKTGEGEYGHGDIFIGVTVPEQREVAREYKDLPLPEILKLLKSPIHECRLTALILLVGQYQRADARTRAKITKSYLANTRFINNWDLVDSSAPYILGEELLHKDRRILYNLVTSRNMWERRIAILATFAFIRRSDFTDSLALAKLLLADSHDLIHKSAGWMLREVGKRSRPALALFLRKYASRMPRTMLRYAIERFPEHKRKKLLKR